jgi:hypothetical protein
MKFVLFVEGYTEQKALPDFLRKWLEPPRLPQRIGVKVVRFEGWTEYYSDIAGKVASNLSGKAGADVIAGIGLLDLYGPTFYPKDKNTRDERYSWAKKHIEDKVGHHGFRQHFATHETEAWLLSEPEIFPKEIQGAFPPKCARPETVNFDKPPAALLEQLYRARLRRSYGKVADGQRLFRKLNPDTAYKKCDYLRAMLDEMVNLAKEALK